VVASLRPKDAESTREPPTLRPVKSEPQRAPDSVTAALLQLPSVPDMEPSRSAVSESEPAPSAEPARNVPAAPMNAAWSKLLDDQGTAGGW
jgi:hypothetical protein